ncbi:MAG: DUF350 domain-containing protein [Cyclobacteriaceae bacterium]|nr:DUF350 domain-containing protein [Cyclobacteriaceae bacterium]
MTYIDATLTTVVYLASSFVLFFIGKYLYQFIHKYNVKDELVEKDNLAFALAHTGYFAGLVLSIGGIMMGETAGLLTDLIYIGIYGCIALVLLNLSIIINDRVILRKFSVKKEIAEDQNAGTGVVEGASAIATGLIIMGSVYGEGGGIGTMLIYWVIGQVLLIGTAYVYNWITPFDIYEHIEKDNVAVGVGMAGAIIAIGNLIRHGLMHDFESWEITAEYIAIDAGIGLVFLPIARLVADKILLPGRSLTDELINQEKPNIGAGIIEAFAYVGGSVLICWSL